MARGISVEILKSQAVSEVSKLFIVSRASTKESKRTSLVPHWITGVVHNTKMLDMLKDNFDLARAISGYLGLYLAILGYLGLSEAISGYLGLSLPISGYSWQYLALMGYLSLYQVNSGYL